MRTENQRIGENKELIKKYPWLQPKNIFTSEPIENCTYLDWLPEGWRNAFGKQLAEELNEALGDFRNDYKISDVKEKHGELVWSDNCGEKEVEEVLAKYGKLATNTCVVCGGVASQNLGGYECPLCDKCLNKSKDE